MSWRDDFVALRHMLDAARETAALAQQRRREEWEADPRWSLEVLRRLHAVGEAARQVSEIRRGEYPDVMWPAILRYEVRFAQAHSLDRDALWAAVTHDVPRLISVLQRIVPLETAE